MRLVGSLVFDENFFSVPKKTYHSVKEKLGREFYSLFMAAATLLMMTVTLSCQKS